MNLKKVNITNFDRKDLNLVVCPNCNVSNFRIFEVSKKDARGINFNHLHISCIHCDIVFCVDLDGEIKADRNIEKEQLVK